MFLYCCLGIGNLGLGAGRLIQPIPKSKCPRLLFSDLTKVKINFEGIVGMEGKNC